MFNKIVPPGIDPDLFTASMREAPEVSLKLNLRKCQDVSELGYGSLEPVKWCDSGYYLNERPKFTLNPLLHAGVFYVQDASSMIYESIIRRLIDSFGLSKTPLVLDMCAAPGGKTTSIINALSDGAFIVANEAVTKRAFILNENMIKWGYPHYIVTNSPTSDFAKLGEVFDLVAVDAPCSGEGMMRKDEEAVAQWSTELIQKCCSLQRKILCDAVDTLLPGGFLIYSTCTFNRTENEENTEWLVNEFDLETVNLNFPEEWGIGSQIESANSALRFMPHITRGEGLFVSVFRKKGELTSSSREKTIGLLKKKLKVLNSPDQNSKDAKKSVDRKNAVRPDISIPLSYDYISGLYPEVQLSFDDALSYLRRESLKLPDETPQGFVIVKYKGHPLGFVKNIGNRANNLYPNEWRIRIRN